jgi:stage V sporulation protein G
MNNITIDVRAFPLQEPQGSTKAFANATFKINDEDFIAIKGIRVVEGNNGLFTAMPQSLDKKTGEYHDIAFPVRSDIRKSLNSTVLAQYSKAMSVEKKQGIGARMAVGVQQVAEYEEKPKAAPMAAKKAPDIGD